MPEPWEKSGDQDDDGPWKKYQSKTLSDSPALGPPYDPIERGIRGFATGVETAVDRLAPFQHDPKLTGKVLADRPRPTSGVEQFTNVLGEIAPSFMVPELGVGRAVGGPLRAWQAASKPTSMLAARSIPVAEATAEGAAQGAAGAAMVPGQDRTSNAMVGAPVGGVLKGSGVAARAMIDALPLHVKGSLSALAAIAAAVKMGMPWWAMWNPYMGSALQGAYNSQLADLAAKYFAKTTRAIPAATAGAVVGEAAESTRMHR